MPGSGGACDIACLSQRTVVILAHDPQRLVARVTHITSPGNGDGDGWRRAHGLPARSGPSAIITTMGVLRFSEDGEAFLASIQFIREFAWRKSLKRDGLAVAHRP